MRQGTLKNFLNFLKKPDCQTIDVSLTKRIKILFVLYIITLVLLSLSKLLQDLFIYFDLFEEYSQKISILPKITSKENSYIFLLTAMILGPIFEELVFRLMLTQYNKQLISISLSLLLGYLLTIHFDFYLLNIKSGYIYSFMAYIYPVCFAIPFYIIAQHLKLDLKKSWNRYYPIIFYTITIIFALMHIPTLTINKSHYLFIPVLILPFIVIGITLGFIRTRLGIIHAMIFHFLLNLPMILRIFIRVSEY
jgi:membrane protease YdiL (CAAX protease family)